MLMGDLIGVADFLSQYHSGHSGHWRRGRRGYGNNNQAGKHSNPQLA